MKLRKLTAILMALVMIFALSATAFANENATVTLVINNTVSGSVSSQSVTIGANSTVYDVVDSGVGRRAEWTTTAPSDDYSPLRDSSSVLYNPTADAEILISIDGNGSIAYEPDEDALDEYGYYIPGVDSTLDYYNALYAEFGGIDMWYGYGMAILGDYEHMIYIGTDWTYTVNGNAPGLELDETADPMYGGFFQYYMNEALVNAGDVVELTYSSSAIVF